MKTLKIIGILVLIIIALPLFIAIFIPRTYTVSVSETINQPYQVVYDYVRILENQKDYSIWVMQDPNLNPEILGIDGTVGAVQRWNSTMEDVGEGEQEITNLTPERMEVELRFKRPFAGTARAANIFTIISENETKITNEFYNDSSYPMNLPFYLFGRKMMREAQTQNLQNLKQVLETDHQ